MGVEHLQAVFKGLKARIYARKAAEAHPDPWMATKHAQGGLRDPHSGLKTDVAIVYGGEPLQVRQAAGEKGEEQRHPAPAGEGDLQAPAAPQSRPREHDPQPRLSADRQDAA